MFFVKLLQRSWIKKDGSCTLEGNAMVFEIPSRFDGVPLESILKRCGHLTIIP
jgi:hypothetical protein